jgi:radical SAM superfamily enzyme YgiQ (UPF0313 family)
MSVNAHLFTSPEVMLGDEINSAKGEYRDDLIDVCVVTPTNYSGMAGNVGIEVLYGMLRDEPGVQVQRAYFPETPEDDKVLHKCGVPYFSVEHKCPLWTFDVLACTVPSAGFDLNIARMLHTCGVPIMATERTDADPIVVRGGSDSYSVASIADWYDAIYIGDGEVNGLPGLRVLWDTTRPRAERLLHLARTVPGWFVPSLYTERYDERGRVAGWDVAVEDIPRRIVRQRIANLDESFHVTKPLMTYIEQGYAEATFLVSRGCTNHCAFCAQAYQWAPYRELSKDKALELAKELFKNTGSTKVIPVAFCSSSYSERKALLSGIYQEVSDQIKLISQRVDEMADDPEFVDLSARLGNVTVSFGVEGASQRLRDAVAKNVTEDDILKATELAIKAGYHRIKYFLIANLPGETQEDLDELLVMAEKIRKLVRDDLKSEADVKFSWTPLMIQPFAPLQWEPPSFEKSSLDDVLVKLKEMGFTIRVGPSGRSGHRVLVHIITMGDRRAARPLADLVVNHDAKTWWNFPASIIEHIDDVFDEYGLDYEKLWFRKRERHEVLPWDFIDIGVTKDYLWSLNDKYWWAISTPKCTEQCTKCGACDRAARKHIREVAAREQLDKAVDVRNLLPVMQRRIVNIARLKLYIDYGHRFVAPVYWKYAVRRAANLSGLQIHKKYLHMVSDTIKYKSWVYGTDYMDIALSDYYEPQDVFWALAPFMPAGLLLEDVRFYGPELRRVDDHCKGHVYRIAVDRNMAAMQRQLDEFLAAGSWEMKKKLPIMRKSWRMAMVDIRPNVLASWLASDGYNVYLDCVLTGNLSPGEFCRSLFGTTEQRVFRLPAERTAALSVLVETGQEDFFRNGCSVCGKLVEMDMYGDPIGPMCLEHQH